MPIEVRRVYWWSDWLGNVRWALKRLGEALWGCQHKVDTIRFGHIGSSHGLREREWATWHVNRCSKCGKTFEQLWWSGEHGKRGLP